MRGIALAVCFQLGWFASVYGASLGFPWIGPAIILIYCCAWLVILPNARSRLRIVLLAGLVGFIADTLLLHSGVVDFPRSTGNWKFSPPWMVGLWVQLALLAPALFSYLIGKPAINAVIGALAGPCCYVGGEGLGSIIILEPNAFHYLILAGIWALAFATLMQMPTWKWFKLEPLG